MSDERYTAKVRPLSEMFLVTIDTPHGVVFYAFYEGEPLVDEVIDDFKNPETMKNFIPGLVLRR